MLVYEQDGNVFAFLCKAIEGSFDGRVLSLLIDNKKVLLVVWWRGDMLDIL